MPKLWRHLPWIAPVALLLAILISLFVGGIWVRGFLRSDEFRNLVSEKTGSALHGVAEYGPLRWQGSSVFSDRLAVTGDESSPVKGFTANQIRAEVNWRAVMSGAWRVDEINVGYLEGAFSQPGVASVRQPSLPAAVPSGLWGFLPRRFELGALNVAQVRLGFGDAAGREWLSLRDSSIRLVPDGAGWTISGAKGVLAIPHLPELSIETFRSRIQDDVFFLTDARFRLGEAGKVVASGEFGRDSKIQVEWQQVDVEPLLNTDWKSRLSGVMAGDATILLPAGNASAATVTGKFQLTEGLLQNLALLDQIATFTGAPQFRRMPLQQLSGNYSWAAGQLSFTNLVIESKGLMRLEGSCVIAADGKLQGLVRLGVTPQTLQWLPGSRERVFTLPKGGYLWTDVRLAGTIEVPQEDLSARLVNAAKSEVIQQGVNVLQAVPGPAGEGARKALDILSPLIP